MYLFCSWGFTLLHSSKLPQVITSYFKKIDGFTISLWEILVCYLGHIRSSISRTFSLIFFFPSCCGFFSSKKFSSPLLAVFVYSWFSLHLSLHTAFSVSQLHCHLSALYSASQKRVWANWLVTIQMELLAEWSSPEDIDKWLCLPLLPLHYPGWCGRL